MALGFAVGTLCGAWVFAVTIWTAYAGSPASRRALVLLCQYFPGYRVTAVGGTAGLLYAFGAGFAAGYVAASIRNGIIRIYLGYLRRRAEQQQLSDILDRLG